MIAPAITRSLQARAHRGADWCRTMAADIRALQLDALEQSVQINLAGPAMHYADPGTEALFAQLEGPAEEGAQPPYPGGAGLTPAQRADLAEATDDRWLLWLAPVAFVLAAAASALSVWGQA